MGEVVPPIPTATILTREAFWNTLAAVELAQAGDPTTDNMNTLGEHDAALREQLREANERADRNYDDLNDPFAAGLRTRAEEAEALAEANDALYHWAFKRMEAAEATLAVLIAACDRVDTVDHGVVDGARAVLKRRTPWVR